MINLRGKRPPRSEPREEVTADERLRDEAYLCLTMFVSVATGFRPGIVQSQVQVESTG